TVIALRRHRLGGFGPVRRRRGGARQAAGRMAGDLEFVAMDRRMLPHMVDDQDLVRKIEDEVALILGARQFEPHRLELEHQVVAERAVEAEMLVLRTSEQVVQGAQYRKDAGLTAALLLGKPDIALAHLAGDAVLAEMGDLGRREAAER